MPLRAVLIILSALPLFCLRCSRAEDDFSRSQLRAGAQLGCILTLVGYSLSFLSHDYDGEVDALSASRAAEELPSAHFYTIPVLRSPSF